ncbi:MAG: signal peptide peptidase SppA [Deltaproteobacteria bacterium]|nr:signal peptide peptidase SppA [Deltaproteobacteria bacterium]
MEHSSQDGTPTDPATAGASEPHPSSSPSSPPVRGVADHPGHVRGGSDRPTYARGTPMERMAQMDRTPPRRTSSGAGALLFILVGLVAGVGFGGACVALMNLSENNDRVLRAGQERVGVVELTGEIVDAKEIVAQVRSFARRTDLKGIVVRIDSPGGAVAPSQEIFQAMRWASKKMPVVASMGSMAASGGFWASLGADYVFASPGSVTGSIGVITQTPDLRGIADLARVKMRTFKSGPLKDAGNPFREMTAEDEALFMGLINDIYTQFVETTAERRKLPLERVKALADGRVLTGRAAKEAGLVDELGDLYDAARKVVTLAARRPTEGADKGSEATDTPATRDDVDDDPTLVYPREPGPRLMELLMSSMSQAGAAAVSEGVAHGLAEGLQRGTPLGTPVRTVELR